MGGLTEGGMIGGRGEQMKRNQSERGQRSSSKTVSGGVKRCEEGG